MTLRRLANPDLHHQPEPPQRPPSWRAAKDDPGSGEKALAEAHLVSLAIGCEIAGGVELRLYAKNLTGEAYRSSADRKAPVAPGRSVGVGFVWSL